MENESIGEIPGDRRHGKPRQLFFLWFSSNMQLTTIVTGAIAWSVQPSLLGAVAAVLLGNLAGGCLMALHAAQGPRMSAPQTMLSRTQFGWYGAALPLTLFALMFIGFFSSTLVISAAMLTHLCNLDDAVSAALLGAACIGLVLVGERAVHALQRVLFPLFLAVFAMLSWRLLVLFSQHHAPTGTFSWGPFLSMLGVVVTWQISYTPYVSDYGRSISASIPLRRPFFAAFTGTFTGTSWMMLMGVFAAWLGTNSASITDGSFLLGLWNPPWRYGMDIVFLAGMVFVNVFNLYGGFISVTSVYSGLRRNPAYPNSRRAIMLTAVGAVGVLVSVWGSSGFMLKYSEFLTVLLEFLIPWSSIQLVDFYWVQRGVYDPVALGHRNGSRYGLLNWRTYLAYGTAVIVQFSMVVASRHWTQLETAANLSWVIGLIVSGVLYYWVTPRGELPPTSRSTRRKRPVPRAS